MARRPAKREGTRARAKSADASGLPQFSASFVAEVGACDSVEAFRELLDRKGIWLNRNAAQGVFSYLQSLANPAVSDEELAGVVGGVASPLQDQGFIDTLRILSDQLG